MAERILLSRLRYIGDVVLTTPCIRRLRENFPKAEIAYLSESPCGDLLQNDPFLTRTISFDRSSLSTAGAMKLMWELNRSGYGIAIDLLSNPRSAILTASTCARRRVGTYHLSRSWAYNVNVRVGPEVRSAVEHHLEHVRRLGIEARGCLPELFVTNEEEKEGKRIAGAKGVADASRTVLLQPGAKWQAKRWPAVRFEELARLILRASLRVAWLAGPGEESYLREHVSSAGEFPVVSGLTLRELMRVLSACAAYVGNDGGPAHVAAALKRPTVAVFGPSEPDIWFPYEGGARATCVYERANCRPCHLHVCEGVSCLERVDAERVFGALMNVLADGVPPVRRNPNEESGLGHGK